MEAGSLGGERPRQERHCSEEAVLKAGAQFQAPKVRQECWDLALEVSQRKPLAQLCSD